MKPMPTSCEGLASDGDEELLTKKEVCQRLRLGDRTVDRWMRAGRLPFHRLGKKILRFRWHEILAALERQRKGKVESGKRKTETKRQTGRGFNHGSLERVKDRGQ